MNSTISSFSRTTANLGKMGHYPTTEKDAECISSLLYGNYSGYLAFDPCCGNGLALQKIIKGANGKPVKFGAEIEPGRAEDAKDRLDYVFEEDFFNLDIESGAFGLIFLNPPYHSQGKIHQEFIEKATGLLAMSGVLVLLIPSYELTGKTASYLASHYDNVRVFRSTDETFQQIILFGVRKKMEMAEGSELAALAPSAESIERAECFREYDIPATRNAEELKIFIRSLDPEKLQGLMSGFDEDWKKLRTLIPETVAVRRPLLPPRKGHLAQLLASGYIDGVIVHPETKERFLVKGTVTRVEEKDAESDECEEKTVFHDVVSILMMNGGGVIEEIK